MREDKFRSCSCAAGRVATGPAGKDTEKDVRMMMDDEKGGEERVR